MATLLHRRTGLEAEGGLVLCCSGRGVAEGTRPGGSGERGGNRVTYHVAGDRDLMYAERWKFDGNESALSRRP